MSSCVSRSALATAVLVALMVPARARAAEATPAPAADPGVLAQMVELNKQAIASFKAGKPEAARPQPAKAERAPAPTATPASLIEASKKSKVAKPAEKTEKAEPTGPEEPDLPVAVPQPLYCAMPAEGPPDAEITVRCLTQPKV